MTRDIQNQGRPVIFLHIGAHKTASTLMQSALNRNTDALAELGVKHVVLDREKFYPDLKRLFSAAPPTNIEATIRELSVEIEKSMAHTTAPVAVVSNESFSSPRFIDGGLYANAAFNAKVIHRLFEPYALRIVIYVRRQDSFVESCYLFSLKKGSSQAFERFLGRLDLDRFHWQNLISPFVERFGPESVTVLPFEGIKQGRKAFLSQFFRVFLEHASPESVLDFDHEFNENRSYSEKGMKIARACNNFLGPDERGVLRRFLEREFSSKTGAKPILLSSQAREALLGRLRTANRDLFRAYMPGIDPNIWE